jgi:hypothetical protein
MTVAVERKGVEMEIRYWPRGFEMAKSWQMVKVDDE